MGLVSLKKQAGVDTNVCYDICAKPRGVARTRDFLDVAAKLLAVRLAHSENPSPSAATLHYKVQSEYRQKSRYDIRWD